MKSPAKPSLSVVPDMPFDVEMALFRAKLGALLEQIPQEEYPAVMEKIDAVFLNVKSERSSPIRQKINHKIRKNRIRKERADLITGL